MLLHGDGEFVAPGVLDMEVGVLICAHVTTGVGNLRIPRQICVVGYNGDLTTGVSDTQPLVCTMPETESILISLCKAIDGECCWRCRSNWYGGSGTIIR